MSRSATSILILIAGALLFIPFLGKAHLFDWDEINFAEAAREMIVTDDYTRVHINYLPFWEKPPLFFWMQAIAMKWFGINEFAARFPNAICGIATLIVLFLCGSKLYSKKFGIYWALAYAGSIFPTLYFKSGIIDPWFNLFIFLSLYFFILYHWKRNGFDKEGIKGSTLHYAIWSGLFMGLAMLTKGQVALMIFLLVLGAYFIYNRFQIFFGWRGVLIFLVVALITTLTWFGYETMKHGPWFITEFFRYQYRLFTTHDAGQKGFFGYHYIVLLFGCFPASVLAIPSFFKSPYKNRFDKDFKIWMLILFWVVTILFSIVQSRIIHYSSLAWFPLTFLAAYTFYKLELKEMVHRKYISILVAIVGGIIALLLVALPVIGLNLKKLIPYVKDEFAKSNMEANVYWSGFEAGVGLLFIIALILGLLNWNKKKYARAIWIFFAGTAIVVFLTAVVLLSRIEQYSQGAAIEFFKSRKGEDCYVHVLHYKSYAHLFYTEKKKPLNDSSYSQEWLLRGKIDKPVYFVSRVDRLDRYKEYTELKELYRKNGFVFLRRDPQ